MTDYGRDAFTNSRASAAWQPGADRQATAFNQSATLAKQDAHLTPYQIWRQSRIAISELSLGQKRFEDDPVPQVIVMETLVMLQQMGPYDPAAHVVAPAPAEAAADECVEGDTSEMAVKPSSSVKPVKESFDTAAEPVARVLTEAGTEQVPVTDSVTVSQIPTATETESETPTASEAAPEIPAASASETEMAAVSGVDSGATVVSDAASEVPLASGIGPETPDVPEDAPQSKRHPFLELLDILGGIYQLGPYQIPDGKAPGHPDEVPVHEDAAHGSDAIAEQKATREYEIDPDEDDEDDEPENNRPLIIAIVIIAIILCSFSAFLGFTGFNPFAIL